MDLDVSNRCSWFAAIGIAIGAQRFKTARFESQGQKNIRIAVNRSLPNDNKISENKARKLSIFYCHGISQEKERFWTIIRKFSLSPTPSKTQILLTLSFRRL